jgi:hypothetical protein
MVVVAYLRQNKLSTQCVLYIGIKISFIKHRFLKSMFRLRGKKRSTIAIYKQSTPTFLSAISPIMFHAKTSQTHDIPTKLRYWIPWAWNGHVVPAKSKYADSKSTAYLRGTWLKTRKYQTVILAYLRYVSTGPFRGGGGGTGGNLPRAPSLRGAPKFANF